MTMTFDFDSQDYIAPVQQIIGCKAINAPAGLWVGSDKQRAAGWIEGRETEGGKPHSVATRNRDSDGVPISIPGVLFRQPRLSILGASQLLGGTDKNIEGLFDKSRQGKNGYKSAKKYLLIFLDSDNRPLHVSPIQLTAWSVFGVKFEEKLREFRQSLILAYGASKNQPAITRHELWYAMWTFCPEFKSEEVKNPEGKANQCCITTSFKKPTVENLLSLCAGRNNEVAEQIMLLSESFEGWWKRGMEVSLMREAKPMMTRESLMSQSDDLMRSLGWEVLDGANFIDREYGVRSRIKLSDGQLLDFVGKLQTLPQGELALQSASRFEDIDTFENDYPPY